MYSTKVKIWLDYECYCKFCEQSNMEDNFCYDCDYKNENFGVTYQYNKSTIPT